jgi:hypothetical protein
MPRGDEEEITVRDEECFRFVALLATRGLLERPTLNPSLIRDQLRLMASVASNRPALMKELRPGGCVHMRIASRAHASNPIGPQNVA